MQLTRFRHKGLKQIHAGVTAKGVPAALADKLRKLLFALETADGLGAGESVSRLEIASAERCFERFLELDRYGELAVNLSLPRRGECRQRYRFD